MFSSRAVNRADANQTRLVVLAMTCRSVALYGFAGWVYVALVALIQPKTLSFQLTHLLSWPRTDTFGEISFLVSFLAFWLYSLIQRAGVLAPAQAPMPVHEQTPSRTAPAPRTESDE